ncbi:MAG: hypothetical protein ABI208_09650 [Ginsengibacter sp.]
MRNFKDKLYHYEALPPDKVWDRIAEELYDEGEIKLHRHGKRRFLFYGITAAASIVIIFLGSLFFKNNKSLNPTATQLSASANKLTTQIIKDSISLNQKILKSIINNPEEKKEIVSNNSDLINNTSKKYLTVEGPTGQPIKISPKVATLIISADNEYPPKPVWSKKIDKWQKIMLSSTISPTSANLVDMIQMATNNDNFE